MALSTALPLSVVRRGVRMADAEIVQHGTRVALRLYVGLVVLLVAGAMIIAWLLSRGVPSAVGYLEPEPTPVTVTVTDVAVNHSSTASLTVTYDSSTHLLGSGRMGTVTAVGIRPDTEITQGQVLYEVDALPIRGYVSDVVFYRQLRLGSAGEDVRAAQELLNSLVASASLQADGRFGAETERAVRDYESSLGVDRTTGVFDPAWFVRVPHSRFTVAEPSMIPGEPAPARAEPFAAGTPTIFSATISTAASPPDGDYEFVSQGRSLPITRTDGEWRVDVDDVTPLLALAVDHEPPTQVEGMVRLAEGLPGQGVPPAALIDATNPHTCVALVEGADVSLQAVELLGSSTAGVALISPDLPREAEVLVNAHALGHDSCP